jgi:hypothetical protein
LRKTEIYDFDPAAFFLQNPDQIGQTQGKDWIGHLLSIDRDEKDLHKIFCKQKIFRPLTPSLSPLEIVSQYEKTNFLKQGERRSGGKDLER